MLNKQTVLKSFSSFNASQYSRFSLQQGIKPIEERIITGPPQYVNLSYDFIVWTHYMDQMNSVSQQFLNQTNRYWGDETSYRFFSKNITDLNSPLRRLMFLHL